MNQMVSHSAVTDSKVLQEPPASFRVRLVESGLFSCKYVIGEADENALCCGAPTDGKSWCAYHRSVVFDTYRFKSRPLIGRPVRTAFPRSLDEKALPRTGRLP